ncbi:MAG: tRNA lysidine(34) synthetase TilS [Bacteroidia bacterium]|nr:tRNA lysidine(34) synthetase TilS [Bacteroidia bacterium]
MLNDFLKYIEENHLVKKGNRILAAVSGGIDSMVMADLLLKSDLLSGIAHCNFCLRKEESDMDEALVREFAAKHFITFHSKRFATKQYAKKKGISIEMAARELRYGWFEKIRKENGYDLIAVAHNLNDNAETLLLNLIRGTGIAGLSGMKISGNHIIRPLLFSTRKSIEAYCRENKISYREDKTNADTKFTRNKIRHEVIPLLKEINPSIELTLNETAEKMSGIHDIVSDYVAEIKESLFVERENNIIVNISRLKPYVDSKALMYEIFKSIGITASLLKDLRNVIFGRTGGQIFTATYRILKNRNEIVITEQSVEENKSYKITSLADLKKIPFIASYKIFALNNDFKTASDQDTAYLDSQKIRFPLAIRKWQPGDFFYPFGMNRKKKLSDYLIDRKLSRLEKEKIHILESGGKIAWVIGERIDDRFRITRSTKKVLVLMAQIPQGKKVQGRL